MQELDAAYSKYVPLALSLLQGKWTVQILGTVHSKPSRLSELKRQIPSASKKALTANLRGLELAGIIERKDLSGSVLHVEYEITEHMREPIADLLNRISDWSRRNLSTPVNRSQESTKAKDQV